MSGNNKYDWMEFYKELSEKLLAYKSNRQELVTKVKRIFLDTGISMPTLERGNQLVDIDPFTVFGLFNKSSMTETNRVKIVTAVKHLFDVAAPVPSSFASIPVLNNQNATFYYFIGERDDGDINSLWELFDSALAYAESPSPERRGTLSKCFDVAINMKGNKKSKITMGLYWIAPDTFLNLDKRNTWYIYESGKLPLSVVETLPAMEANTVDAKTYFAIVEKLHAYLQGNDSVLNDFMELSSEAWRYSEEINEEKRKQKADLGAESNGHNAADDDVETRHYWLYSPGKDAEIWDECYANGIMAIGWNVIGDLNKYESKTAMKQAMKKSLDPEKSYKMAAHATWQFVHDMKPGDVVFAKKGLHYIIGRGIVQSEYIFDDSRSRMKNVRRINWTHKGEWVHPGQAAIKTLTDITSYTDYVEKLNAIFENGETDDAEVTEVNCKPYSKSDFLDEVYMDEISYETLVGLVRRKKNVILQGAPGTGKTFAARRLAYSIMGVIDPDRVMMVQFHQSYSYEDFIMGYRPRPSDGGFELRRGAFYNFCKAAEIDSDNDYFFVIDEINRGNLSKIFGELFMLIESDKRGEKHKLQLLYSGEKFFVPENVYIIGLMNTADRSLAMLDYALRRRFAFYEMKPGFDSDGFREYRARMNSDRFDNLIQCVKHLNTAIADDDSLGEGFCIGHSYFCKLENVGDHGLSDIVEYELIPLLKEYWFDEPIKVERWADDLRGAIR